MYSDEQMQVFINSHNYDLRESGYARWIDQKCTPDVIWVVADCVLKYADAHTEQFNSSTIWKDEYTGEAVSETFSKPDLSDEKARREYDKFFSQPLNLLCYAGVLRDTSVNRTHSYIVADRNALEYIAINEKFALRFLLMYTNKVISDSGLSESFERFFTLQDQTSYLLLKRTFSDFYHKFTPVKGEYEPNRIFTKALNTLAFSRRLRGTEQGRISPNFITRSDLMYNRDNFRDLYSAKPKDITRQEWLARNPQLLIPDNVFEYQLNSAKQALRSLTAFRGNVSELTQFDAAHTDTALPTQIHHIFPKSEFPVIMHFSENLIALTPNQHYGFAHPNNNTQTVSAPAQKALLIAKTRSVRHNLTSGTEPQIFTFDALLEVLSAGFHTPITAAHLDFDAVIAIIEEYYFRTYGIPRNMLSTF